MATKNPFDRNPTRTLPTKPDDTFKNTGATLDRKPVPSGPPSSTPVILPPSPLVVKPDPIEEREILDGQRVETVTQLLSTRTLVEALNIRGDKSKSRGIEICIAPWHYTNRMSESAAGVTADQFSHAGVSADGNVGGLGRYIAYANIEFGAEYQRRSITIDCSRGTTLVVPASNVKVSVWVEDWDFTNLGPQPIIATSRAWCNITVSASYANANSNLVRPTLTSVYRPELENPADLNWTRARFRLPNFASSVRIYAKAGTYVTNGQGASLTDQYFVNGIFRAVAPIAALGCAAFSLLQFAMTPPDEIMLPNDVHEIDVIPVVEAGVTNIHELRAVFSLSV